MYLLEARARNTDYFDEDFDENKNCKEEELINKLMKEESNKSPIRCSEVSGKGSDLDNWKQCKNNLIHKLRDMCNWKTILEVIEASNKTRCNALTLHSKISVRK